LNKRKACLPASTSKRIYHGIGVTVFLPLDGLLLLTQLSYSLATAAAEGLQGLPQWKAKGKILEKVKEWNCISRKMKRNLTD
jgi:hypothetical protein